MERRVADLPDAAEAVGQGGEREQGARTTTASATADAFTLPTDAPELRVQRSLRDDQAADHRRHRDGDAFVH